MDDTQKPAEVVKAAKAVISAEEAERRRAHVHVAMADSRIEGIIEVSSAEQEILDAYVRGDIEARDLVAAYKSAPQPR